MDPNPNPKNNGGAPHPGPVKLEVPRKCRPTAYFSVEGVKWWIHRVPFVSQLPLQNEILDFWLLQSYYFLFVYRRGKPLYLSRERFDRLQEQWLTHSFDHMCKRWKRHMNTL